MSTRIGTYASQQTLNNYLRNVQKRIIDTQVQLTSEKISQDYIGIGSDTQRLVGYEVDTQLLTNFKRGNDIQKIYLQSTSAAVEGIEKTISEFRKTLTSFNTQTPTNEQSIKTLQENAFRSLQSMQSYLNTEVNGRYLFAGNRTNVAPVDLGLTNLTDFQTKYDGVNLTYPTSRTSHLEDFNVSQDGNARTNWLTFRQDADGNTTTSGTSTITATTAQFSNVEVGSIINVTGTANNNGRYEVAAVSGGGTTIEIVTKMLTTESNAAATLKTGKGLTITPADVTNLSFNRSAGTITAATGSLSGITVGDSITVSGSAQNNGTYIVESNTGSVIKIKEVKLTDEGTTAQTVSTATAQDFTFTNATSTIAAGAGTPFSSAQPGMKVTFTGTTSNNATYTVASVLGGGSSITVVESVTTEAPAGSNDTVTITTATPTLDLVAKNFNFTNNASGFDTIAAAAGTFSAAKAGMTITFGGMANAGNNATFTIASVSADGSTISVKETLTTEVGAGNDDTAIINQADGTIQSEYYYKGDAFTRSHRLSETRDFTIDLNAIDPAFEKAIRAMSIIAQGKYGTAGGLDQTANQSRISDALNLANLSLSFNDPANPQYEVGQTNSIEQSLITLGYQQSLIETVNTEHTRLIGFFDARVAELENIDLLDVTTRLLDDQRALEASYRAMANIRSLSLHNFIN